MNINDYKCFVARDARDGIVWLTYNPDFKYIRGEELFLFTEEQLKELIDAACAKQRDNCAYVFDTDDKCFILNAKRPKIEDFDQNII